MGIIRRHCGLACRTAMHRLDMITTSVLGALGCDMQTFIRYFPAADTMYKIFVGLAIGIILLNLIWQLFKNFVRFNFVNIT